MVRAVHSKARPSAIWVEAEVFRSISVLPVLTVPSAPWGGEATGHRSCRANAHLGPIDARLIRLGFFCRHRSRLWLGQRAAPRRLAWPAVGVGGLDRNVPRSAGYLRPPIWVAGCIREVAD